jgi:DNA replication protein DnaC
LAALPRVDALVHDDWGLAILDGERRRDLLELLDEHHQPRSTLVTSQLLVADWRDALGDPTLADVIRDRLVHHAHALNLAGESLRKLQPKLTEEPTAA